MNLILNDLTPNKDYELLPDVGKCSSCGWSGKLSKCHTETDGDWEFGYYEVPICPTCSECIDDYSISDEQYTEWLLKNPTPLPANVEEFYAIVDEHSSIICKYEHEDDAVLICNKLNTDCKNTGSKHAFKVWWMKSIPTHEI